MPTFITPIISTTVSFDAPNNDDMERIQTACKETPSLLPLLLGRSTEEEQLSLDLDNAAVVDRLAVMLSSLSVRPTGFSLRFSLYEVNALNRTEVMPEIPELIRAQRIESVTITKEPSHPTRRAPAVLARLTMKGVLPLSTAVSRVETGASGAMTNILLNSPEDVEQVIRSFQDIGHASPSGVLHLGLRQGVSLRDTPLPDAALLALHRIFIRSITFTNLDRFSW